MNMKKVLSVITAILIIFFFSVSAFSFTDEELELSGANELSEYLSEETLDYMKRIGCEDIEFEKMLGVSPAEIFELFSELIKKGTSAPIRGMMKAAGAALMISVISGFFPDDEKSKSILNIACGCFVVVGVLSDAAQSVGAAVAAIESCAAFEKALIPVLAAILTVGGNPAAALSVRGTAFAAAQVTESLAKNIVLPLLGLSSSLNICGAVLPTLRLSAVGDIIRKTATTVLATSAGLFSGLLGLKAVIAVGADSLAVKGVKMASGTFIPVIGSALGEIYTSFSASISLLKTTVGVYAIVAFIAIGLPIVINLALWALSMKAASAISDLLDCRQCSELLKNMGFIFSGINTVLILCMSVFIVTAGVTVLIKNGG